MAPPPRLVPMGAEQYGASLRFTGRRDTKPERDLRKLLRLSGLRYRVAFRLGSGRSAPRSEIAFPRQKIAVFGDGCFWHQCPEHEAPEEAAERIRGAVRARKVTRAR